MTDKKVSFWFGVIIAGMNGLALCLPSGPFMLNLLNLFAFVYGLYLIEKNKDALNEKQ